MLFNFGKCKCLHTGTGNTGVNYEMGGTILSKTVKEKDLGVTMNANMKVSEQCRIAASKGVIDLTLPPLPEGEYPLPVRSICLNIFRKTLYRLPPLFAEDGRGLRTANISKWQPQKTRH